MQKFNSGWYLIYTRPRHEKKVSGRLTEMNIDTLLPTRKQLRVWHDRRKHVDEPLFPSYVFVYLNDLQSYYVGMDIEGVLYYVRSGNEVSRINESVINNIRLASERAKEIEVSAAYFQPGQRLVIRQGALTGLSGEVVQVNGNQKLLIRVALLQRNILMTLSAEDLMAVNE